MILQVAFTPIRQALPDALHLTVAGEALLQGKTLARDVDPDECLCWWSPNTQMYGRFTYTNGQFLW